MLLDSTWEGHVSLSVRARGLRYAPAMRASAAVVAARMLLTLAALGGSLLPWVSCARASHVPVVARAAALVDVLGSAVCHQRPERSFWTCGYRWPVCGRCSSLYLGAAAGTLLAWAWARRTHASAIIGHRNVTWWRGVLVAVALPTAVLWTLEYVGGIDPGTPVRFAGGLPLGLGGAAWLWAVQRGDLR